MSNLSTSNIPVFSFLKKANYKKEASKLHQQGFTVIPIKPNAKKPATKWAEWEDNPTEDKISTYWDKHPNYEVGIITNSNLIVFDADSEQSKAALYLLEETFDTESNYIVKTRKGEHHYFNRPDSVYAKQDSFDSDKYPDRIDIKTDRSLVVAPPSGGKEVLLCEIDHVSELTEVTQEFIDAVFKHNGREAPRAHTPISKSKSAKPSSVAKHSDAEVKAYLEHIDPDCSYEEWLHVGMGIYNHFGGIEEGLEIFDSWSSKGSKYTNYKDIEYKWKSFAQHTGKPITIATIVKMAKANGADLQEIKGEESFDVCEMTVVHPEGTSTDINTASTEAPTPSINPLAKYVINDDYEAMREQLKDERFVLNGLALQGQLTNFYAQPNSGKTLMVLYEGIESVRSGEIDGKDIYYINADDGYRALVEKTAILKEHQINVLAPSHKGFKSSQLLKIINYLIDNSMVEGKVLIFDTLKKFTDIMSKSAASEFWKVLRAFSSKGGTVISLAHTNKNPDKDGNLIYGGTTDSLDDTDCAYTIKRLDKTTDEPLAFIEIANIKNRGSVVMRAAYQFSIEEGLSYRELLDSVVRVEGDELARLTSNKPNSKVDEPRVIETIIDCISEGVNKKMGLAKAVAEATGQGRNAVIRILEQYTGSDPLESKWNFKVAERGAKVFYLLDSVQS